jgi:hypothetical protein
MVEGLLSKYVDFEVPTVVTEKSSVFWDKVPYSLVKVNILPPSSWLKSKPGEKQT